MSLLTEDGKLYVIAGDHEPLNKELAPLATKTACTGQQRRDREGESAHRKAVAEAGDDYGSVSRFGNKTPTAERIQMKKRIIIIGLLGLALGVWRQPIVSTASGFVYPANERGNSLSTIEVGTGQVKNIVTRITPHDVQVSRDGRLLLAVGPVSDMTANQSPMKMSDAARAREAGF